MDTGSVNTNADQFEELYSRWSLLDMAAKEAYAYRKVTVRQEMDLVEVFAGEDTKFVIKEDIDLGGKTVKIGEGAFSMCETSE